YSPFPTLNMLTRQIHEQLIADGLMAAPASPRRSYGAVAEGPQPRVAINPPDDASAVLRVRCIGASGDVLLACAVAGALKVERPGCYVILETARPQVAYRNPYIDAVVPINQPMAPRERLIDTFDLRPEADWQPRQHRLRQFADAAGVALASLRFFIHTEEDSRGQRPEVGGQGSGVVSDARAAAEIRSSTLASGLWPPTPPLSPIVLHPGPTECPDWKGRNWLPQRWDEVARRLAEAGERVVIVGKERDQRSEVGGQGSGAACGIAAGGKTRSNTLASDLWPPPSSLSPMPFSLFPIDLRGHTTIHQLAHLISQAKLFVGIESLPAIIAQSLGVPAVLFFGSIAPELRVFRENVIAVTAPALRCLGCHHDEPLPTITYRCRVGGEPCQSRVTVAMMLDAVRSAEPLTQAPYATKVVLRQPAVRQPPPIRLIPHSALRNPHSPTVLLRRETSDGDVLVASSVAAAVKKRFPACRIVFETRCPALLKGHPYIDEIVAPGWTGHRDLLADMNAACEDLPYTNMLAVYASRAAVSPEECEFFVHTEPVAGLPDEYAVMHMGPPGAAARRWVGRAWSDERFLAVARHLAARGLATVLVGAECGVRIAECGINRRSPSLAPSPQPLVPSLSPVPCNLSPITDLRGKTTLYQLAHVVAQAKLFVGIDSLPFHIAQALNVRGVAFFGSIRPELRIYRENMIGVSATELPCIGCHHDRRTAPGEPPETAICRIGHEHCRTAVTVRRFVERVEETLSTLGVW
ncbi:MAG TPA: glycosyltransferase family 9 protein, partial [Pirellulales bacterium]